MNKQLKTNNEKPDITKFYNSDLAERLIDFEINVVRLVDKLPKTVIGNHIGEQLLNSATSPGSDYEEARRSNSKDDFIHKLKEVFEEIKESRLFLKIIERAKLLSAKDLLSLTKLTSECDDLFVIVAKNISAII
ncbi:MAG: four helix bundle protein [Endomicrobiales bacterium]|nr:four helix bundle protein [Endomicrobiales bacterium]